MCLLEYDETYHKPSSYGDPFLHRNCTPRPLCSNGILDYLVNLSFRWILPCNVGLLAMGSYCDLGHDGGQSGRVASVISYLVRRWVVVLLSGRICNWKPGCHVVDAYYMAYAVHCNSAYSSAFSNISSMTTSIMYKSPGFDFTNEIRCAALQSLFIQPWLIVCQEQLFDWEGPPIAKGD